MKNWTSVLLMVGIIALLNVLAYQFFFRLDFTEDERYTLSPATENVLKSLEDPVTITAYFTKDLPPQFTEAQREFNDIVVEYNNLSGGLINYEIKYPEDDEMKREAAQGGVQPFILNVRENNQASSKEAFMGAVIAMGEKTEALPIIQPQQPLEYPLTTKIKKIAVTDKPAIGLVQGHGEAGLQQLAEVNESLSILYTVETLTLDQPVPETLGTIAIINPQDSIPPAHFAVLDAFIARGGHLLACLNTVNGDFQTSQGSAVGTGLENWLATKGIAVTSDFVIDASCGSVSVQQQRGFFNFNTPVQFPFLPLITNFAEHPITDGMSALMLTFASPIEFIGGDDVSFTPIAFTSDKSGVKSPPVFFDVNKKWSERDFPKGRDVVAGIAEGTFGGDTAAKIVVVSDGDFPINEQGSQRRLQTDNVGLMVNSIDWLTDDSGLINLRTKGFTFRPIDEMEESKKGMLKYLNFLLPLVLVLFYGIIRFSRNRAIRNKRMKENYG